MNMADLWIAMPLLLLAAGALVVLVLGAIVPGRYGSWTAMACCCGAALWSLQTPPVTAGLPYLASAPLVRLFTVLFCLLAAAVLLVSENYNRQRDICGEEYPATILFATFGMVAVTSAASLLTLFLGLEAMTFGFYVLVAMDLKREPSGEAGLKYLLLGAAAAGFLAFGMALLYFATGTLTSVALLKATAGQPLALVGWGFMLIGIAFKLSLVPAHLWTPDVYQGAPAPVVAFLSGGSKAAAILFAVLLLAAAGDAASLRLPLLTLSLASMLLGNLAALLQKSIRRMLAYSAIAQMGYVALALVCGGTGGYQAALYYGVVYLLITFAAFGAIALFESAGTSDLLDGYKGGGGREPFAAALLALAMFALAGIPPTAGFTGKFMIFAAALRSGEIAAAVIGIITAAVSAYYYLRVVVNLYMVSSDRPSAGGATVAEKAVFLVVALLIL
ncbi:MAG: NADH-quinone oxidoreductase subunit N, partial [Geobacter sp.]|nr:NADH-quinone oxidoreductase subunit N [Geobacter sp.]